MSEKKFVLSTLPLLVAILVALWHFYCPIPSVSMEVEPSVLRPGQNASVRVLARSSKEPFLWVLVEGPAHGEPRNLYRGPARSWSGEWTAPSVTGSYKLAAWVFPINSRRPMVRYLEQYGRCAVTEVSVEGEALGEG